MRISNKNDGLKEQRRTCILQAARQVFARKGYETTVLEEVAREAGLAKGTLYLYFKNKEDLYFHTVLHMLESLQASITAQVHGAEGALGKLRALAAGQFDFFLRHRDTLQLFAPFSNPSLARLHKRLIAPIREKWAGHIQRVIALVEEGQRAGVLRRDLEARQIAQAFIGMTNQAAQALVRFGPEGPANPRAAQSAESPERMADTILKILVEGVGSR